MGRVGVMGGITITRLWVIVSRVIVLRDRSDNDVSRTQTGLRIVDPFEPDHAARRWLVAESIDDLALGWGFLAADVCALLKGDPGQPA